MKYKLTKTSNIPSNRRMLKRFVYWLNAGETPKEAAILVGYARTGNMEALLMTHVTKS